MSLTSTCGRKPCRHRIASSEDAAARKWKIAVIDDDQAVHEGTRFALSDYSLNGQTLEILSAYSAAEGRELLRAHPDIHDGMTLLVRQLPPGPTGLPLEVYCFTRTVAWGPYEGIQSDIFDHLLAILPEFGLQVFQQPGGADVRRLHGVPGAAVAAMG